MNDGIVVNDLDVLNGFMVMVFLFDDDHFMDRRMVVVVHIIVMVHVIGHGHLQTAQK